MATIRGYDNAVLYSSSGTLTAGANALIYVYSQGCYVNGAGQTLTSSAGQTLTVRSIGSFAAGDWVKFSVGGTVRQLSNASGTTLTFAAGTAVTSISDAQHLLNVGTAQAGTSSKATIYSVNDDGATAVTSSLLTADSNGQFQFFAAAGTYDLLIQNSSATDLYVLPEVSLPLMSRNSSTGLVYATNATDDFAVGGSDNTAALFVDESAEIVWVGGAGTAGTDTFAAIDGANATLTASGATPTVVLADTDVGLSTTIAQSTSSSSKTVTLPNITGTVIVDAGAQTLSGNKTFSGTNIHSGAATFSNTVTVSGAQTNSSTVTHTGTSTDVKRLYATQGTSLVANDFTISAAQWGTGSSASVTTGSKSTRFTVTITAGTTPAASPTTTLTFADGAFTAAPFVIIQNTLASTVADRGLVLITSVSTTAVTWQFYTSGAVTNLRTYTFTGMVIG